MHTGMTLPSGLAYNRPVKRLLILLASLVLLVACGGDDATSTSIPSATTGPVPTFIPSATASPVPTTTSGGTTIKQYPAPPPMTIEADKSYTARINTNRGTIEIELFSKEAPKTVNSFVFLAGEGFYDGVIFHRVIKDFMLQGGDPTGTGTGGPGYRFEDEIVASLVFDRPSLLAMANSGPGTNGSQFFITLIPTPHLNGLHTIFGQVVGGQDVVDDIGLVSTDSRDRPLEPVVIESIEIIAQ